MLRQTCCRRTWFFSSVQQHCLYFWYRCLDLQCLRSCIYCEQTCCVHSVSVYMLPWFSIMTSFISFMFCEFGFACDCLLWNVLSWLDSHLILVCYTLYIRINGLVRVFFFLLSIYWCLLYCLFVFPTTSIWSNYKQLFLICECNRVLKRCCYWYLLSAAMLSLTTIWWYYCSFNPALWETTDAQFIVNKY